MKFLADEFAYWKSTYVPFPPTYFCIRPLANFSSGRAEIHRNFAAAINCSMMKVLNTDAMNNYSTAKGNCSPAEGNCSPAEGNCSPAEGNYSPAEGNYSSAENDCSPVINPCSSAETSCSNEIEYYIIN